MKRKKIKKYYGGGATDTGDMGSEAANAASTAAGAASVGAGDSGPTDPGIATDSITSFGGNFKARSKALGLGNLLPGSSVFNAIGAIRDTAVGRKAMGLSSPNYSSPKETDSGGGRDTPVCNKDVSGKCIPEAKRLSKGGEFSFSKNIQQSYYKDIL